MQYIVISFLKTHEMKYWFLLAAFCLGCVNLQAQEVYNSSGKSGKPKYRENAKKTGFDATRLVVGGGIGGGFGYGVLAFQISPVVGYRFNDRFSAGIGLSYQYFRYKNGSEVFNTSTQQYEYHSPSGSIISPSIWGRCFIFDRLFASVIGEYNFNYRTDFAPALIYGNGIEKVKLNYGVPSALVGLGYAQPITNNASFVFLVSYDVLQSATTRTVLDSQGNAYMVTSPYYRTLDVRIGVNLGF